MKDTTINSVASFAMILAITLFIMSVVFFFVEVNKTDWVKTAKQYKAYEEEKSQMTLLPEEVAKRFVLLLDK